MCAYIYRCIYKSATACGALEWSTVGCSVVRVPHWVLTGYSRGTHHRCDGAATFPYLKSVVMELDVHSLVFCSAPTAAAVRPPVSTLVPPTAAVVRPPVSTLLPLPCRRSPSCKSATVSVTLREPERACVLCCVRVCVHAHARVRAWLPVPVRTPRRRHSDAIAC
jgi:hypothetical protein